MRKLQVGWTTDSDQVNEELLYGHFWSSIIIIVIPWVRYVCTSGLTPNNNEDEPYVNQVMN